MPVYEYKCNDCAEEFEKLVMGSNTEVTCPKCGAANITKKFSLFGMSGVEKPTAGSSGCSSCSKSTCTSCS